MLSTMQTVTRPKGQKNVPADRLGGVKELAEACDVRVTNVTTWINRREVNGFPEPVIQLAMGGVYSIDDVLDWRKTKS
jgi:hypothetical protein